MDFQRFQETVKAKFPNLTCTQWVDREVQPAYMTTDGSVIYSVKSKTWQYNETKSRAGIGKTLDEAMADATNYSLDDELGG